MFELYKRLKDAGFPQGGAGSWMLNPDNDEQVYVPLPGEIYTQFLGDPAEWADMSKAMAEVWIAHALKAKNPTHGGYVREQAIVQEPEPRIQGGEKQEDAPQGDGLESVPMPDMPPVAPDQKTQAI